jgi:hypothetical protein
MKLTCYVVCTIDAASPRYRIMTESYSEYVHPVPLLESGPNFTRGTVGSCHTMPNTGKSFGESYNAAVHQAFDFGYERVVICNDDIVFAPHTHQMLMRDVDALEASGITNWGHVACRADNILRNLQWIGNNDGSSIRETTMIAPICSVVQPSTWVDFPHCNTYSDNVQCWDMARSGARIFVSRAYVHHVGGLTIANRERALSDAREAYDYLHRTREDAAELPFLFPH